MGPRTRAAGRLEEKAESGAGSTLPQDRTGSTSAAVRCTSLSVTNLHLALPKGRASSSPKRPKLLTPPKRAELPKPLSPSQLTFPDRHSGPVRDASSAGHFQYSVGENLTPRFKIMRKFGEGTFGQVLECWDRRRGDYVAIKVIRAVPKYRDAAMVELRILRTLAEHDPGGRWHCAQLLDWFEYRGHICMVFERLGPSLFDYLRRNSYAPFPLDLVRDAVRQLLESLTFLHSLGLVHTDLKPENVLQRGQGVARVSWPTGSRLAQRLPASNSLCLIDFGSAIWDADPHAHIVSTRHYRAPEVVLGTGWSWPADLWSLGCMLVELLTGDALFATHENKEHLAMMERILGPIPASLAARIPANHEAAAWFRLGLPKSPSITRRKQRGTKTTTPSLLSPSPELPSPSAMSLQLDWPRIATSKKSVKAVARVHDLATLLRRRGDPGIRPHLDTVLDLIRKLLAFEPDKRSSAAQLLRHPFFAMKL